MEHSILREKMEALCNVKHEGETERQIGFHGGAKEVIEGSLIAVFVHYVAGLVHGAADETHHVFARETFQVFQLNQSLAIQFKLHCVFEGSSGHLNETNKSGSSLKQETQVFSNQNFLNVDFALRNPLAFIRTSHLK